MREVAYILIIIIIAFFIIALIPMNNQKENCIKVSGTVKSVSEGGVKDLVFN